jgi:hypothetical protein
VNLPTHLTLDSQPQGASSVQQRSSQYINANQSGQAQNQNVIGHWTCPLAIASEKLAKALQLYDTYKTAASEEVHAPTAIRAERATLSPSASSVIISIDNDIEESSAYTYILGRPVQTRKGSNSAPWREQKPHQLRYSGSLSECRGRRVPVSTYFRAW